MMSAIRNFCWGKKGREEEEKFSSRCLNTVIFMGKLRCVTTLRGRPIYQRFSSYKKICESCYLAMTFDQQRRYAAVSAHLLAHMDFLHNQEICTCCRQVMLRYRDIEECQDCLNTFEYADMVGLTMGWGYPSIGQLRYRRPG
jgi:hypothetical protein